MGLCSMSVLPPADHGNDSLQETRSHSTCTLPLTMLRLNPCQSLIRPAKTMGQGEPMDSKSCRCPSISIRFARKMQTNLHRYYTTGWRTQEAGRAHRPHKNLEDWAFVSANAAHANLQAGTKHVCEPLKCKISKKSNALRTTSLSIQMAALCKPFSLGLLPNAARAKENPLAYLGEQAFKDRPQ